MNPTKSQIRIQTQSDVDAMNPEHVDSRILSEVTSELGYAVWNILWGGRGSAVRHIWSQTCESVTGSPEQNARQET